MPYGASASMALFTALYPLHVRYVAKPPPWQKCHSDVPKCNNVESVKRFTRVFPSERLGALSCKRSREPYRRREVPRPTVARCADAVFARKVNDQARMQTRSADRLSPLLPQSTPRAKGRAGRPISIRAIGWEHAYVLHAQVSFVLLL